MSYFSAYKCVNDICSKNHLDSRKMMTKTMAINWSQTRLPNHQKSKLWNSFSVGHGYRRFDCLSNKERLNAKGLRTQYQCLQQHRRRTDDQGDLFQSCAPTAKKPHLTTTPTPSLQVHKMIKNL